LYYLNRAATTRVMAVDFNVPTSRRVSAIAEVALLEVAGAPNSLRSDADRHLSQEAVGPGRPQW
jgi:hypothetical protein